MAVTQAGIMDVLESIVTTLNPDDFIYDFLDAYGFPKSTITRLRNSDDSRNVGIGDDIALKKRIYFKKITQGASVSDAADELKSLEVIARNDIRFILVTDFKTVVAYDLKADERLEIDIKELDKEYGFFLPLAGYEKAVMYSEHPADLKASEKMGKLFDLIKERNDLSKAEDIHALNVFLTRLLFCFYAEDTGIFETSQMTKAIQSYTKTDGSNIDEFFSDLFMVLNLEENSTQRKAMPAHFQAFPYVNGGLFKTDEPIPEFGSKTRRILVDCGSLDWSQINPDIFGSMFQAVIDSEQRGNLGQHYTSVSNIMKVIQPLFLDGLYEELEKFRSNNKKLKSLLLRLQNIKIFDPACGSGNFLIIAYKELRKLEMEIIDVLNSNGAQTEIYYSGIKLSQFYGIEIDDFAHEVAMLSLWLAEHQMNSAFKSKFGYAKAALPLSDSGNIICGNSLRINWSEACPRENSNSLPSEVYLCGNPPFLGASLRTTQQNEDMDYVFKGFKKHRFLDYVACFFWKGANYVKEGGALALVSTNSLCQGEQVAMLWPEIFNLGVDIFFAYPSFPWSNNAKSKATVHVAVIGLSGNSENKYIYRMIGKQLQKLSVKSISPYLLEGNPLTVSSRSRCLYPSPPMIYGSKPVDGGHLFLNVFEKEQLIHDEPKAEKWIRKVLGADEFINSKERYCLWLNEATEVEINAMPLVKSRVEKVREMRLSSKKLSTHKLAETPHVFAEIRQPLNGNYILVPSVSSHRRQYIPIGFMGADVISTNLNMMVPNGTLYDFGMLTSEMHNDWMRVVAGRLGVGYRYSATIVYNTFPWPEVTQSKKLIVEELTEQVLLIREDYSDKPLGVLYDPDKMPAPLLAAHKALDRAVEKLYRESPFRDASERLEHLFSRYEKLVEQEKLKKTVKKGSK